jgi:protein involved in polysaccharide export with SLBB domain
MAHSAAAQVTRNISLLPTPAPTGLTDLNNVIFYRTSQAGHQAFDAPVNPEAYRVGPGDQFEIDIWSPSARSFSVTVTPEGTLLIPAVGEVQLTDVSLSQARERILAAAAEVFPGSEISATLIQARRVRVHVSGLIPVQGTYEMLANQRVSDVLARGGEAVFAAGSVRNVTVVTRAGARTYDLLAFFAAGDEAQNPYLAGGEHILIQPREPLEDQLQIAGAVLNPGFVEFREGDRVSDLIRFGFGFRPRADLSRIVLTRTDQTTGRLKTISLGAAFTGDSLSGRAWQLANDAPLERGDRVYVAFQSRTSRIANVAIYGEIMRPGHYAVLEDSTMLSDLVMAAGGPTPRASRTNITFLRPSLKDDFNGDTIQPLVSVNVAGLLAGDRTYDIALKQGDSIYVPAQSLSVQVLGRVRRPGLLPYATEQPVSYYVERAGGYDVEANEGGVRVVRSLSGAVEKPKGDRPPEPGDRILVPARSPSSVGHKIRDFFAVVGVAATISLIVWGISQ